MDPVSDSFLLQVAEISAGLIGLFLVGMVFYIQTGYDRQERFREVVEPYFRAATTITFITYAIPLGVSLTLVALPIVWSRLLYLTLVLGLITVNVTTVATVRAVRRVASLGLLVMIEVVGTAVVALMVILPLATGGLRPEREDLVPAILLSLGIAFLGTWVLVVTLFDIARIERSELPDPKVRRAMARLRRRSDDGTAQNGDPSDEQSSNESEETSDLGDVGPP